MPSISVVIPCYNVEKYLSECLDSVLNQTFKDFEIICVEDCSTDKTKQILQQYAKKHKNITVFYNETNQGQAISRNIGIKNSHGKYICFVDSDDYIRKDCLETLYNHAEQDNCDIVMGSIKVFAENKKDNIYVERSNELQKYVNFTPFSILQITNKNSVECYETLNCCPVNKLYKRDFLTNNNIYFINKKCFHEDDGFWLKILACNPLICGVSANTYFYRIRSQSTIDKMALNHKTHLSNVKESLNDALFFVKSKKNKPLERFIKSKIYKLSKHRFVYFVWDKVEKRLRILFLPIFSRDERKIKLLGIPVYKFKKQTRILFLMDHMIMGGLEKVLLQYLEILHQKNIQCTVISKEIVTDDYFLDFFRRHKIKFIELKKHKFFRKLKLYWYLYTKDIIINFDNFSFFNTLRNIPKRKIGYCHGSILFFNSAIDKRVLDIYDDIVCLSDSFRSDFVKQYPQYANKIHHIYNPINSQDVIKLSSEKIQVKEPYFVAVQRLDSLDKYAEIIIKAFNVFSEKHPEYFLYIVGDGPQHDELVNMASGNKKIIFTGKINNPYPYIKNAKALILSSTTIIGEGLPNTLLEAHSLGTLAISSDVPSGPHEILMDGAAGLLFKPGDYKDLARILNNVSNNKYDTDKMINTAKKNMYRFDALTNVNKLLDLINKK